MARPKVEIDERQVTQLARIGCTNTEIAEFFGVSEKTVRRRFAEILTKGRASLKKRLRKKQVELALKGHPAMLIWLGKQYLDQSDKQEIQGSTQKPLVFDHAAAVAAIARRPAADHRAPGTAESRDDGAEVG